MVKAIPDTRTNENRSTTEPKPARLRIDEEGFALLRERLRAANRDNPDFEAQADDLLGVVRQALEELRRGFGDRIVRVLADGEWAHQGIDLRSLPDAEDVVLLIVTRFEKRGLDFESSVGRRLFPYIHNRRFLLQIDFLPRPLSAQAAARVRGGSVDLDLPGIPLLTEA
jgi:hypothetical protein